MPAMLDDPTAPAIYRVSGSPPYPLPYSPLPPDIGLRQVTLRDRVTIATLVPFSTPSQVPPKLTAYLCELLNREIEKGDTYPMLTPLPLSSFGPYWFANFGAVMLLGDLQSVEEVSQMEARGVDWARECLGSFYVKPNYPGRSSHVCNGGFLVTDAARNRGVGRLMGEGYLEWAPKLGYTYSVFNLVYETNVASLRIWDGLGFKRIGRVKGCGNLKSFPDQYVDAIIFGRDLGGEGDEYVSEERFDKIRFYLKTGTYPNGSDRAEKSRLRSAATHYRLVPNPTGSGDGEEDKLMLKGKEVVADPNKQYEIACATHAMNHGGINKTTAGIAEKYHWVRIKETVSAAIRGCAQCKDMAPKPSQAYLDRQQRKGKDPGEPALTRSQSDVVVARADDSFVLDPQSHVAQEDLDPELEQAEIGAEDIRTDGHRYQEGPSLLPSDQEHQRPAPTANMHYDPPPIVAGNDYEEMPVDPQIMQGIHDWTQHHPELEADQHSGPHTLYEPQPDAMTEHSALNGNGESDTMAVNTQPHEGMRAHELMMMKSGGGDVGMEGSMQADLKAQDLSGTMGGEGQRPGRGQAYGQQSQQLSGRNG
ncbi:Protein spt10 [Friedmanniomyces endolithicus]|uniref:Protein spt10 n=1 Tax=Friedmanniomyces endolithicus TaxID=329885 RepID=A0AAN6QSW2_9PEZI|nr:Protein spt10 [Friedmanniomyces endolithicus]KAK0779048.1 Protein spt10 [Friedmanniomyces endolithicus]KAK0784433.1 Protein spt10 [Friedmanniomyces endolithicus]KAK0790414.1 Protein spt10 [Friedmanniomyces endolithicus]KAK0895178.1 Protein spt10 [Friedmanniomyces endolithicus]